jgi:uncharacterized GH25 family protein
VKRLLATAGVLAWAASAVAHDTWLRPHAFRVAPGATLRLELTSGGAFPDLDWAPEPERLSAARVRLVGVTADVPKGVRGEHALVLTTPARAAGVAAVWVSTKPVTLTLQEAEVEEYLHEIGASEALRMWRERKATRDWRESYRKHAKTLVQVGGLSDESWREPVGIELEIVPEADPFALRAGAALPVRVLKRGKPLAGFPLAVAAAGAERRLLTTDGEGRASIALDRPGPWLLAGTEIRANGEAWESDFTTLTLEVRP